MLNDLDCIDFAVFYSAGVHATRLDFGTRVHYRLDHQELMVSISPFVSAPHLLSTLPSDVRIHSFKLALKKYMSSSVYITLVGSVIMFNIIIVFFCTHKLVFFLFQESMLDT